MGDGKKAGSALGDREQEALAYFFSFWWAVIALAPGNNRGIRNLMADLGFIEKRGPLKLTRMGKRVLKFAQADDRPRYPRPKRRRER